MPAPRLLDVRFLTLHPRTELWWKQREECRQCAHVDIKVLSTHKGDESSVWQCTAAINRVQANGRDDGFTCISMRDEGARCGTEGRLWTPQTLT